MEKQYKDPNPKKKRKRKGKRKKRIMGWRIRKKESGIFAEMVVTVVAVVIGSCVVFYTFCLVLVIDIIKNHKSHEWLAFQQQKLRRIHTNYYCIWGIEGGGVCVLIYCGYSLKSHRTSPSHFLAIIITSASTRSIDVFVDKREKVIFGGFRQYQNP